MFLLITHFGKNIIKVKYFIKYAIIDLTLNVYIKAYMRITCTLFILNTYFIPVTTNNIEITTKLITISVI